MIAHERVAGPPVVEVDVLFQCMPRRRRMADQAVHTEGAVALRCQRVALLRRQRQRQCDEKKNKGRALHGASVVDKPDHLPVEWQLEHWTSNGR